jgi:hypothetical protein
MLNKSFTTKNVVLFGIVFQSYFIITCLLAKLLNPETASNRYFSIFLISETILAILLWNWKQRSKSEMLDERESEIRLRIKAFTSRAVEITLAATIVICVTVYKDMPALFGLLSVGVAGIIAEMYGNYMFRKE